MTGALPEHALLLRDFANTVDVEEGTDELGDPAALVAWLRDHGLISCGTDGAGPDPGDTGRPGTRGTDARDAGAQGAHNQGKDGAYPADEADLETAIALRTSLRAAMRAHHQRPHSGTGVAAATPATGTANTPATGTASGTRGVAPAGGLERAAASLPLRVTESAGNPALVPVEGGVRGGLARLAAAMVASTADRSWERLKICAEDSCQWAFLDSSKNRSKHWCSMLECGNRSKTRAYRARRASAASGQ